MYLSIIDSTSASPRVLVSIARSKYSYTYYVDTDHWQRTRAGVSYVPERVASSRVPATVRAAVAHARSNPIVRKWCIRNNHPF